MDEFDDMEFDEFGDGDIESDVESEGGGGDRDPIVANIKDAKGGLEESLMENKVETAKEVGKHFLNSLSDSKTSGVINQADKVIDNLNENKKELGRVVAPILDLIPGDEDSTIGKYVNIAKNWLLGDREESSGSSSEAEDPAIASANAFMEGLSLQDDSQQKLAELQKQVYAEGTKAIINKMIDSDSLFFKSMTNDSIFYHKSIELQFRLLAQMSLSNEIAKKSDANIGELLSSISKNTALPDIIKAKSSEALMATARQEMGKSLFSRFTKTNWMTNLTNNLTRKADEAVSKVAGLAETVLMPVDMINSMGDMGGSAGHMAGNMAGDTIKEQAGSRVANLFGKTKVGSKVKTSVNNALEDPNSVLSKFAGNNSFFAKIARGFKELTSAPDEGLGEISVNNKDINEVTQFDNKTHTSINLVIPTLLGDILREIKLSNGKDSSPTMFDYESNKFVSKEEKEENLKEGFKGLFSSAGKDIEFSSFIDDVLKHSKGVELSVDEKRDFLKTIMDANSKDGGLNLYNIDKRDIFKDLDPDSKEKFSSLMSNYTKDLDKENNLTDGNSQIFNKNKKLQNIEVGIDATAYIEDRIKNGYGEELEKMGIVEYDKRNKRYILNRDKYYETLGDSLIETSASFDKRDIKMTSKELKDYLAKAKETGEDTSWLDNNPGVTQEMQEEAEAKAKSNSKIRTKVKEFEDKLVDKLDSGFDYIGGVKDSDTVQTGVDITKASGEVAKLKAIHELAKVKYQTIEQVTKAKLIATDTPKEEVPKLIKEAKLEAFKDMQDKSKVYAQAKEGLVKLIEKDNIDTVIEKEEFEEPTSETVSIIGPIEPNNTALIEKLAGEDEVVKEDSSPNETNDTDRKLTSSLYDKLKNRVKDIDFSSPNELYESMKQKVENIRHKTPNELKVGFVPTLKEAYEMDKEHYSGVYNNLKERVTPIGKSLEELKNEAFEKVSSITTPKDKAEKSKDIDDLIKEVSDIKERENVNLGVITDLVRGGYSIPDIKKLFEISRDDEPSDSGNEPKEGIFSRIKGRASKFLDEDGDGFRSNSWKEKIFGEKESKDGTKTISTIKEDKEEGSGSLLTKILGGVVGLLMGGAGAIANLGISGLGGLAKMGGSMAMGAMGLIPKMIGGIIKGVIPALFKGGEFISNLSIGLIKALSKTGLGAFMKTVSLGLGAISKGLGALITIAGGGALTGAGNLLKSLGVSPKVTDMLEGKVKGGTKGIVSKAGKLLSKLKGKGGKIGLLAAGLTGGYALINNYLNKDVTVDDVPKEQKHLLNHLDILNKNGIEGETAIKYLVEEQGLSKEEAKILQAAHNNTNSKKVKEVESSNGIGTIEIGTTIAGTTAMSYMAKKRALKDTAGVIKENKDIKPTSSTSIKEMDSKAKAAMKANTSKGIFSSITNTVRDMGGKLSGSAMKSLKAVGRKLPFVGAASSAHDAYNEIKEGNYGKAAMSAMLSVMQMIPVTAVAGTVANVGKGVYDALTSPEDKELSSIDKKVSTSVEEKNNTESLTDEVKEVKEKPSAENVKKKEGFSIVDWLFGDEDKKDKKKEEKEKTYAKTDYGPNDNAHVKKTLRHDEEEGAYGSSSNNSKKKKKHLAEPQEYYDLSTDTDNIAEQYKDANVNIVTKRGIHFNFKINDYDKILLEQIAAHESKRGDAGYKVTYGMNKYLPRKNIDITKLTISQIYDLMRYQIKSTRRNKRKARHVTSAMGKYQFLIGTLREVVGQTRLSTNTLYNKSTQDYLILMRLKNLRKYDDWLEGNISDAMFINNLAKEFASIEVPKINKDGKVVGSGRGYHSGQKAPNTVENFLKAFSKMRALKNRTDKPSVSSKDKQHTLDLNTFDNKDSGISTSLEGIDTIESKATSHKIKVSQASMKDIVNRNTSSGAAINPIKETRAYRERQTSVAKDIDEKINELPISKVLTANSMVNTKHNAKGVTYKESTNGILDDIYGVNKEMLRALTVIANKEYKLDTPEIVIKTDKDTKIEKQKSKVNTPKKHVQANVFKVDKRYL